MKNGVLCLLLYSLISVAYAEQDQTGKIGDTVLPDCSTITSADFQVAARSCFDEHRDNITKIYKYYLENKPAEMHLEHIPKGELGTVRFAISLSPDAKVDFVSLKSTEIPSQGFLNTLEYYIKQMQFPKQIGGQKFTYPLNFYND